MLNFSIKFVRSSRSVICAFTLWFVGLVSMLLSFGLLGNSAHAQTTFDWNTTSSHWDFVTGWTPVGPPGTNDIARFQMAITDTIDWDGLTGNRNTGELQILAGNYTFDNTTATQYELTLNSTSSSAFLLSGGSTTSTVKGLHFNVANGGASITGGATLILDGSDPAGTRLSVADKLSIDGGNFNITAGAVAGNTQGNIGFSGATGTATVTGSGSQWNNSNILAVGVFGNGTLSVEAGGLVSNTSGYIGSNSVSTGTATVTGSGSQWNNSNNLAVGVFGNGTLSVEAGGVVSNTGGYIGRNSDSTGTATVTGSGSLWNNSNVFGVGH
jgi:fibronectin-binding autotransporter adhesin